MFVILQGVLIRTYSIIYRSINNFRKSQTSALFYHDLHFHLIHSPQLERREKHISIKMEVTPRK